MENVTIPKQEYDLFLNFKRGFEKFVNSPFLKSKNEIFNPRDFFGLAKISKKEIDKNLKEIKEEWK